MVKKNYMPNIRNDKRTLEILAMDQPEQLVFATPCKKMCKLKYLSKEIKLTVVANPQNIEYSY